MPSKEELKTIRVAMTDYLSDQTPEKLSAIPETLQLPFSALACERLRESITNKHMRKFGPACARKCWLRLSSSCMTKAKAAMMRKRNNT